MSIQHKAKTQSARVRKNFSRSALALAVSVLLVGGGRTLARAPAQPGSQDATASAQKLAGQWQLNKDQSDDPRQKMQQARGDSDGGPGGGGNGGGRGQGGRNGGGRGPGGMMDEMQTLQIDQTGSNVKISGKSGRVLAQYPSSDAADSNSSEGEGHRTTTSQWQNGQLTVVTHGPRGKTTRTFSLSPDGKQLYVSTKMENERFKEPVTYRLVYDPSTSKAGGAQ
jgi:hypothetical protein